VYNLPDGQLTNDTSDVSKLLYDEIKIK